MSKFTVLPCLDSDILAQCRKQELQIPKDRAAYLGRSAVQFARDGMYITQAGEKVDWQRSIQLACDSKVSIPPTQQLPWVPRPPFPETKIQVSNETTLAGAKRLLAQGLRPLALNFANGVVPGGGFLLGARAQEEALCRSSALYLTLADDPMYAAHRLRALPDSTDWCIYSPDVPIFRSDSGSELTEPWLLSFITSAAPYALDPGIVNAGDLLQQRIIRVLEIARAYQYSTLVLGAWGCGAFGNDPLRTATDFRVALQTHFQGVFSNILFAVADWSDDRKFLGPFRDVFSSLAESI